MLDVNKPVQTRSGRAARILATDLDRPDGRKLAVASLDDKGGERLSCCYPDGRVYLNSKNDFDIINAPEKCVSLDEVLTLIRAYCYRPEFPVFTCNSLIEDLCALPTKVEEGE